MRARFSKAKDARRRARNAWLKAAARHGAITIHERAMQDKRRKPEKHRKPLEVSE